MWIIGQSRANAMDVMGFDITIGQQNEDGTAVYQLVGMSVGFNMVLGFYDSEQAARLVLNDILSALFNGQEFYDIGESEKKLFKVSRQE